MTYNQIRFVKRLLAILLVSFGALVAHQLYTALGHKHAERQPPPLPEPTDPVARQIELTRLDSEGRKAFVLRAAESVSQSEELQIFRDVAIEFAAGRQAVPLLITAENCEYDSGSGAVHLEGNVVVRDRDSLRIETEVLDYQESGSRVTTTEPLRFSRQGVRGTAGGLMYEVPAGLIELDPPVAMIFEQEGKRPLDVKSRRARMLRERGRIRFIDEVVVQQENRWLHCNDLQVYLTEDESRIEHIEAYEHVELQMKVAPGAGSGPEQEKEGSEDAPFQFLGEPGDKTLLTEKLEAYVRPESGTIERMRALDGGTLILEPGPPGSSAGVRRELEGYLLAFDFDDAGRLRELRGRGGVELRLIPLGASAGPAKRVIARQLEVDFDPATGELGEARCLRAVEFFQGDLRASAERGVYRGDTDKLTLTETPRLWDPRKALQAERIEIDASSGALEAWGDIRSSLESTEEGPGFFPGKARQPLHFISDHLSYAGDVAVYTGSARGLKGEDRVEADRIELREKTGELLATGSVRTVMVQAPSKGEPPEAGAEPARPTATITLAEELFYRSDDGVLHYRGSVRMRSERMVVQSDRLDVTLDETREEVQEAHARGDVELSTEQGRAGGAEAKYLPKKDEIWLSGEKAWMRDGDKLTEGKELTFFLSNDTIFVDGREQDRTTTTYTSKPRPF